MDFLNWTSLIVGSIGAILGGVGSRLIDTRFNTIKLVLDTIIADNERLRVEQDENSKTIERLQNRISRQELHLITLDSSHFNHPWPSWVKDTDGTMIFVNRAYEDMLLKPKGLTRLNYIGKDDYSVWDKKIADAFKKHDLYVIRNKEQWEGIEIIGNNGSTEEFWIVKYPIFYNKEVVGTAGSAIPMNRIMKSKNNN